MYIVYLNERKHNRLKSLIHEEEKYIFANEKPNMPSPNENLIY
jgi:hypothetical protein